MKTITWLIVLCCAYSMTSFAQTPAFPTAEGWGMYSSGGRGGTVYEVTNLNDDGPGSLRAALRDTLPSTVVFRVSGYIDIQSVLVIPANTTIAGQTAPGDGICVRGYPTKVGGDNVIVRYMRFRLGDQNDLKSDAFNINFVRNVILDHCSISWGADECFSAYSNHHVTVQYCLIGEGLDYKKHSMGGLWGGYSSYHHNMIHSSGTRHPKFAYTYDEDTTDFQNNVIYNWGYQSAYTTPTGRVNMVNNFYRSGPATKPEVAHRIVQAEDRKKMHISGNFVDGFPEISADNWNGGIDPMKENLPIKYEQPFAVPFPVALDSPEEALAKVIAHGGASFPKRDKVDERVINNLQNRTGEILVRPADVGGFPALKSGKAPKDTDHDGMPDAWEKKNGLNPIDATDGAQDTDGDGYTNLEAYLNGLVAGVF